MPTVTYTRLDGSVPAGTRHSIVQRYEKQKMQSPVPNRKGGEC